MARKNQKQSFLPGKCRKRVWVDLDNSPHVPFFRPIVAELKNFSVEILLTARKCFQVCELADRYRLKYIKVGHHYGKNKMLKVIGLFLRSVQLTPIVINFKPHLAISHGSRSQSLVASILSIPNILIADYEYVKWLPFISPTAMLVPEVLYRKLRKNAQNNLYPYPGIKEDVYVPGFRPDERILRDLGVPAGSLVITIRPPASEAHYHNKKSDRLFIEVVSFLGHQPNVCMIILPRSERQSEIIKKTWPGWFENRKIIIPNFVLDGLNLIWQSDLVISGGGTMNREAAALGVPAYSIFAGRTGAVDKYLADTGRLIFIKSREDIRGRIKLVRKSPLANPDGCSRSALQSIVSVIMAFLENPDYAQKAQEAMNA
ncbi:MAG: DUF354 domain-containing protein [Calditrichaeota bacterium]|nr:MAG: DUF354 domain-containing protein [Calditrichota bacterium]